MLKPTILSIPVATQKLNACAHFRPLLFACDFPIQHILHVIKGLLFITFAGRTTEKIAQATPADPETEEPDSR